MPTFSALTSIDFLVFRKFGRLKAQQPPPSSLSSFSLRPGNDKEDRAAADQLDREIKAFRAELTSMPREAFQALCDDEQAKASREAIEKANAEEEAHFFNHPTALADFAYWAKSAHWTIDEGVALLLGRDPRIVSASSVEKLQRVSAFAKKYGDLQRLAERQFGRPPHPRYTPVNPPQFIAWAKRVQLDVPPQLVADVEATGHVIADWQDLYRQVVEQRDALRDELKTLRDAHTSFKQQSQQPTRQDPQPETSVAPARSEDSRTRDTHLRIIGAIVGLVTQSIGSVRPQYPSEAKLIEEIILKTGQPRGLSKRNLETVFADAKRVSAE